MITAFRLKRTLSGVIDCLDKEKDLLTSGDLMALADVVAEREKLVAGLEKFVDAVESEHTDLIEKIRTKSQRNASLMEASMTGLRDAEALMQSIREQQSRMGTYDEGGNITGPTVAKPRHEKRA